MFEVKNEVLEFRGINFMGGFTTPTHTKTYSIWELKTILKYL